jgi:hypothetical protein
MGEKCRAVIVTCFEEPYQLLVGGLSKIKKHASGDNQSRKLEC